MIKIIDQKRTGLFSGIKAIVPPLFYDIRLTIPAREALQAAGAKILINSPDPAKGTTYTIQLIGEIPAELVVVYTSVDLQDGISRSILSLRMESEPPYPGEKEATRWDQLSFTPCLKCGAPLVWYEAGYVPGYRVCTKKPHHHMLAM